MKLKRKQRKLRERTLEALLTRNQPIWGLDKVLDQAEEALEDIKNMEPEEA
jgi:hypothetical protein